MTAAIAQPAAMPVQDAELAWLPVYHPTGPDEAQVSHGQPGVVYGDDHTGAVWCVELLGPRGRLIEQFTVSPRTAAMFVTQAHARPSTRVRLVLDSELAPAPGDSGQAIRSDASLGRRLRQMTSATAAPTSTPPHSHPAPTAAIPIGAKL